MELEYHPHLVPNIFLFTDRKCYPDWKIQKARISFHDLTFVTAGRANYYIDGVKYPVEAGDLVYIPGGSIREAHTFKDSPMRAYPFNFHWAEPHNHIQLPFHTVTKKLITKEILAYIREFNRVWVSKEPFYMIQARALFELILHRLLCGLRHQSSIHMDPRIRKITTFMEENYAEEVTISDFADQLNLHPVYLGKLFKINTGSSYKEYMQRIRINHAESKLTAGSVTVKEAAECCGFHDLSYFSKVFKEVKGYPPSAVKKTISQV